MKLENTYLSDEELEQLIADVEQNELVAAPPDLVENILAEIEALSRSGEQVPVFDGDEQASKAESNAQEVNRNKVREFRRYCFRVATSAIAAVAIVFTLPAFLNAHVPDASARQDIFASAKYATKEEALNDTGILMQIFGGTNIFDNEDKFNIFNGRDGG